MHNRQPITPRLLWKSLKDYDLWPLYILGLTFEVPFVPQTSYLTLTLKGLGWKTFDVNLLTIPYYVGHSELGRRTEVIFKATADILSTVITMLAITYIAEIWNELTLTSLIGQIWGLPLLIAMVALNLADINKWALYVILVLLLSYPNGEYITMYKSIDPSSPIFLQLLRYMDVSFTDRTLHIHHSSPHPSRMELKKRQRSTDTDRLRGMLQHVRPSRRYNRCKHIPRRYVPCVSRAPRDRAPPLEGGVILCPNHLMLTMAFQMMPLCISVGTGSALGSAA